MTEKERILNNNKGEMPGDTYSIVRVRGVENPAAELATFKETMIAFLDNSRLDDDDSRWNKLLPQKLIKFTRQLEEDDYHKDELISHIPAMLDNLKTIRKWVWYSSRVTGNGFDVIVTGRFRMIFLPLLHHQGIPHGSLFIEYDGVEYPTRANTDVLTYKTFNPVSFEMKKK
jgi:hypothetical protein